MPTPEKQRVRGMFTARLKRALGRRLHPHTDLHRKVVAGAIGAHGETFNKWCRGQGCPEAEFVAALVHFFWTRGDRQFAAELFGIDVLPPPQAPVMAAVEALEQAKRALLEATAA